MGFQRSQFCVACSLLFLIASASPGTSLCRLTLHGYGACREGLPIGEGPALCYLEREPGPPDTSSHGTPCEEGKESGILK